MLLFELQIKHLTSDGVIQIISSCIDIVTLEFSDNPRRFLYPIGSTILPNLSISRSMPLIFSSSNVKYINMITLCLYKVKIKAYIMLLKCYRGVIMATNKIQTGIRFEPELLYKITQVAKKNKRSLNAQLEYLAQECVAEFESENGEIPLDENEMYKK